jgi:acyl carrier protein
MVSTGSEIIEIINIRFDFLKKDFSPELSLIDDLGMSSLDMVKLIIAIEEFYGIEISDDVARAIGTIGDMALAVEKINNDRRKEHVRL